MLEIKIKEMIEKDIEMLNKVVEIRKGNQDLYTQLIAKYSMLDKDFDKNIKTGGKACTGNEGFDYRPELKQILEKLKMYILLDNIPIQYTENVANGAIVMNVKKFKNKGIVGHNGRQETNKQTNINTNVNVEKDKKECWLKRIFKKK